MKFGKIYILFVFVSVIITGCKKLDEYSDIPSISFKSLSTSKDAFGFYRAHLVISFTDGDGDIGYHSSGNGSPYDDTLSLYFRNYKIRMDSFELGQWINSPTDTLYSGRIPYLTPTGNNKALKGEIATDIFLPDDRLSDTIRYEVYIFDRALHQSNTVITDPIVITTTR